MSATLNTASGGPEPLEVVALWDWSEDRDVVDLLRQACLDRNIRFTDYAGDQVPGFFELPETSRHSVRIVFDRVSDVQPDIICFLMRMALDGATVINDPEKINWCRDKATMHLELLSSGIRVPYGIIISTADHPASQLVMEMTADKLGSPFVIKPAQGGGGDGVVLNARSPLDVRDYLIKTGADKIVLQRKIMPRLLDQRRGWFRVFWVFGHIIPCWWDDLTHVYTPLSCEDETALGLRRLYSITSLVARLSKMDLFTTEIAMDEDGELVAVDFVNEMPDLRLQSKHANGVPDDVIKRIVAIILDTLKLGSSAPCYR